MQSCPKCHPNVRVSVVLSGRRGDENMNLRGCTACSENHNNPGDYEQVRAEESDVRLLLPKHHLPDPVI